MYLGFWWTGFWLLKKFFKIMFCILNEVKIYVYRKYKLIIIFLNSIISLRF